MITLADLSEPAPEPGPQDWNDEGVLFLPGLIPDALIDAYKAEWVQNNGPVSFTEVEGESNLWTIEAERVGGYNETAYMRHIALFDICTYGPLAEALEDLFGEPGGVHLNLSGWVSTKRDWHQDTYLNPAHVGDAYAAVWIALGDVHPDSGPFQYVPGSHRWHRLTYDKVAAVVDTSNPEWPAHTERILTPLVEAEIAERGAEITTYLPKKGDVLIWHSRLYHRGSVPNVPNAFRPALIAHYSGVKTRLDFGPVAQQSDNGGWFYELGPASGALSAMRARGEA